jgi:PTH1 family peptidyl-tRNA hydrolase
MRVGGARRSTYRSPVDVAWLIVGLGNPGPSYVGSPHNVGFEVVDRLADRYRASLIGKFDGLYGTCSISDADVALLKPLTYMNRSGLSTRPAQKALALPVDRLIVVHDEIDLPFGRVQVKVGGGLAGHNGLRSIAEVCGSREFVRVRMGVGRPEAGDRRPIRDWILQPFDPTRDVHALYDTAVQIVEMIVQNGVRSAMNAANVRSEET